MAPWTAALRGRMEEVGFIRPDMDVRFVSVDRAEAVVPAILAAATPPGDEPAAEALSEKF